MTDLTKLEIWIDEDHKTTAAELLADNEGHADVADAVARLASNKDHTIAIGIGAGWTTLSVLPPVHHSLIEGVTKVLNATRELCEAWGQYGASEIMNDSATNHWYPFTDELSQSIEDMENWRAVLAREKDCCPCDHCAEVVMSDETHGEGGEWLCGDCYGAAKPTTMSLLEAAETFHNFCGGEPDSEWDEGSVSDWQRAEAAIKAARAK